MDFALMGPLEVRDGQARIVVSARHQRLLLAALLLKAHRVVPADELAEVMWEGQPPRGLRNALHSAVQRLRTSLGPTGRGLIATRPSGYLIDIGDGQLDLRTFGILVAQGQVAAAASRWEDAADSFAEAIRLWRGEPLADVPSSVLRTREIPHLTEQRVNALAGRIDAYLHLGRHVEIVAELRQLVVAYPLREGFHAQLMLALYRAGRQADALATYQHARRVLDEELGVQPGAELESLHKRMLEADPRLLPDPGGPHQLNTPPDPAPRHLVPTQLPGAIRHFTGRTGPLNTLTSLLPEPVTQAGSAVVLAISGTAGIGKTALAVHFAHQVAGRFPDGQLYVNLRGFDASKSPMMAAEAIREFLGAFGVEPHRIPPNLDAQTALYRSCLAGKRVLVLLDNAREATQVRPLLPANPGCMVIVTSRSRLTSLVAAEGAYPLTLGLLTHDEACGLLTRIVGPRRIAAEPKAADELVDRCARLPLALSIAAARAAIDHFPLAVLADELMNVQERLKALDAEDPEVNVRAAFSWSYHSLSGPTASMFRRLGLHPGLDITAAAAASLAATSLDQARQALHELTYAHLLSEHLPGRFTFHDLLRAYAAEQAAELETDADCQAATHRLLDHYLHTADAAARLIDPTKNPVTLTACQPGVRPEDFIGARQALAWFEAEHQVLLALIRLAAGAGFHSYAWQLPWTMARFLDSRAYWIDWEWTARTALAAAEQLGDQAARADAHHRLGCALASLHADQETEMHLQRAIDLYQESGDRVGQANVHISFCAALEAQGHRRSALAHAKQALMLAKDAGSQAYVALALNAVGWYSALLGDFRRALTDCGNSLNLHQELGNRNGESHAWDSLGYAHQHLGQYAEAASCYRMALRLRQELSLRYPQAKTLIRLGEIYLVVDDRRAARDAWQQALTILDELHHPDAKKVRASLSHFADGARQEPSS